MNIDSFIKMLVHGDPGIGKTTFLATALEIPELCPILFLDMEGNTDSIKSKIKYIEVVMEKDVITGFSEEPVLDKLNCIRIKNDPQKVVDICNYFYDNVLNMGYKTFMLDSLTAFDYQSIKKILKYSPFKNKLDPEIPVWEHFRKNLHTISDIITSINDLDINFFCTAHSKYEDKKEMYYPCLTGELRSRIPGLLKHTGVMIEKNGKRLIRFQPKGIFYAKDCTEGSKLNGELNANVKEVLEKLYG
mgnify:CR=1 FL=1